jgi:AmmeMemoRadiSam system protein A
MSLDNISLEEKGRILLSIVRDTLIHDLEASPAESWPEADWLREPGACFVTLHRDGQLRGCIGSMIAHRPLLEDVQANARAAAFRDPRFPPVEIWELEGLCIEVSLLSSLERIEFDSEEDLVAQLRPGVDGLLLEFAGHRGTFLPAVWQNLKEPRAFLGKLKAKAGLSESFWSPEISIQRYVTHSWSDSGPVD